MFLEDYLKKNIRTDLGNIIKKISLSCKTIAKKISRAPIDNLYGLTNKINLHGEKVKKLDIISNKIMIENLTTCKSVRSCVSEENKNIINLNGEGDYMIVFDPLDGSSNIDANINIGTIFGIFKRINNIDNYKRQGKDLIVAGYTLYGASTMFVFTSKKGPVNGFTLDNNLDKFTMSHPDIKIGSNNIYSINEGNYDFFFDKTKKIVDDLKSVCSLRYIGSMVADIHRTLLYGGIFIYPATKKDKNGKLRYLYEIAPMSLIIENAGGISILGPKFKNIRVLDYIPNTIHQRTPIYIGSKDLMDKILKSN